MELGISPIVTSSLIMQVSSLCNASWFVWEACVTHDVITKRPLFRLKEKVVVLPTAVGRGEDS